MKRNKVEFPLPHEVRIQYVRPVYSEQILIRHSLNTYETIIRFIENGSLDYKEFFWVMTLSRANRVLGISHLSTGTVSHTTISVQEVLQLAFMSHASAVILIHNHPSGNLEFSETDKRLTRQVQKALKLINVKIMDHLLLTSEGYSSMTDEGLLF
jgi:DNA repair protein RadC